MSNQKLAVAALLTFVATIGWSQTTPQDHAAHHPPEKPQTTATGEGAPGHEQMESKDDLAAIRGLMERAERAKATAERERLLDEHLIAMRRQLDALKSHQCSMDKMVDTKPGTMGGDTKMGDGMKKDHMMMCHQEMKARMDTMAELLEQTWRREELRQEGAR